MTRWSRKCSCGRIHSMPAAAQMDPDEPLSSRTNRLSPSSANTGYENNCCDTNPFKFHWQPTSCRRRRMLGRVSSPIRDSPDLSMPLLPNEEEVNMMQNVRSVTWTEAFHRFISSLRNRGRPSRLYFLRSLLFFVLMIFMFLAWRSKYFSPDGLSERSTTISRYRGEIESLKVDFPGQPGWLWFILDTLALDLIGRPAYQSNDQIRSVIFGVPNSVGHSGSCLAWEVTKILNRIGGSSVQTPINFSFSDIYWMDNCRQTPLKQSSKSLNQRRERIDPKTKDWGECTVEERIHKLMSQASTSGQVALSINNLQLASHAGFELLINPRYFLDDLNPEVSPGSLRLIIYIVHLPPAGKLDEWTVSKVRDFVANLWPKLEPEIELLLKTRLVGNVVLVGPLTKKDRN